MNTFHRKNFVQTQAFLRLRQQRNGCWVGIASHSMREQDVPLKLACLLICCFVLERRMRQKRDGCRRNAPSGRCIEHPVPLSGFRGRPCSNPRNASEFFVWHLYRNIPTPEVPVSQETPIKVARTDELRKRYEGVKVSRTLQRRLDCQMREYIRLFTIVEDRT